MSLITFDTFIYSRGTLHPFRTHDSLWPYSVPLRKLLPSFSPVISNPSVFEPLLSQSSSKLRGPCNSFYSRPNRCDPLTLGPFSVKVCQTSSPLTNTSLSFHSSTYVSHMYRESSTNWHFVRLFTRPGPPVTPKSLQNTKQQNILPTLIYLNCSTILTRSHFFLAYYHSHFPVSSCQKPFSSLPLFMITPSTYVVRPS